MKLMFWVLLAVLAIIPFVVRHLEKNALKNSGAVYELQIMTGAEYSADSRLPEAFNAPTGALHRRSLSD